MHNSKFAVKLQSSKTPLILDGAMGSLLQQRGFPSDKYLWMSYLNFDNPKIIEEIYKEYIDAGCDIITTNTFRTNPSSLKFAKFNFKQEKAIEISLNIAKNAASKKNVIIAGSNPPAEDCYQAKRTITNFELINNHHTHIDLLNNYGADFILNETQSHIDEIKIICKYCFNKNIPYVISLLVTDDLKILSGEKLEEVLIMIYQYFPLLICFNCIHPKTFTKILTSNILLHNWGFYLNCGSGNYSDKNIQCGVSPEDYLKIIKTSMPYEPKLIGACCGSTPAHIKEIKKLYSN